MAAMKGKPIRGTVAAGREALREYRQDFLMCRGVGHQWNIIGWWNYAGGVKRLCRCARCETEREDTFRGGYLKGQTRTYFYPEDYLVEGATMDRVDVQRTILDRMGTVAEKPQPKPARKGQRKGNQ